MYGTSMIDGHIDKPTRTNKQRALDLLNNFRKNIFATEFISDEEATLLLRTIFEWKEKAHKYDDFVRKDKQKQ